MIPDDDLIPFGPGWGASRTARAAMEPYRSNQLRIPEELEFSHLGLEIDLESGRLLFLPAPLSMLCLYNGLSPVEVLGSEDRSMEMICAWYVRHRQDGGVVDPAAESIRRRLK